MLRFLPLIFLLTSCGKPQDLKIRDSAFGIPYSVIVKDSCIEKDVKVIIEETFNEFDNTLNIWNPHSEISRFNHLNSTDEFQTSTLFHRALLIADTLYKETDGAFDGAIGSAISKWKRVLKLKQTLTSKEITDLKEQCGWDKITLLDSSIKKSHPNLKLDFDGFIKGLFCDILSEKLGYKNQLVEWGGDMKLTGGPFKILINGEIKTLSNTALATSGSRFQHTSIKDKTYSHFIDPKTLNCVILKDVYGESTSFHLSAAMADGFASAKIN